MRAGDGEYLVLCVTLRCKEYGAPHMRFKVRLQSDEELSRALRLLEEKVSVYSTSPKRHFIATGDLPDDIREELFQIGATISVDDQYDLE